MTKVLDLGDFWIETAHINRAAIPAGGFTNNNFNLEKPGRFVGGALALDGDGANIPDIHASLTLTNSGTLLYGAAIIALRVIIANTSAGPLTNGCNVIVFLKK